MDVSRVVANDPPRRHSNHESAVAQQPANEKPSLKSRIVLRLQRMLTAAMYDLREYIATGSGGRAKPKDGS